ncbi:hypothetical protein [Haloprofundus salinisoli]|uniref:hypothetical protein n=1 Tax=Haloprofundus salinisoli TaxID=2876193 RepID=UPI001CC9067A|nr:hypothetical protein [Haloprofundus salinisoli]
MVSELGYARMALGGALLLVGAVSVLFPYKIALLREVVDAVGSTRRLEDVAPANWSVLLTRIGGGVVGAVGLLWLLQGYAVV